MHWTVMRLYRKCPNCVAALCGQGEWVVLFRDEQVEVIYVSYAVQQIAGNSGSDLQHSELGVP